MTDDPEEPVSEGEEGNMDTLMSVVSVIDAYPWIIMVPIPLAILVMLSWTVCQERQRWHD